MSGSKKIGIVIHANAMLFANGITQNAYFLYQCLEKCGYKCAFLCNEPAPKPFQYDSIPLQQIVCDNKLVFDPDEFSLIITVTRTISKQQYEMFNSKNIRVVGLVCGNHMMQDQEDFLKGGSGVFDGKASLYDELWTIPCYRHSHVYLETIRKVPVYAIPHLWHPCILEKRALELARIPKDAMMYEVSKHSGPKIDIVIMEPNIALFKHAWLPIVAAERLHMKHPELINNVFVFNYPNHSYAHSMIQTLTLGSKLRPFARLEMDQILSYFANQSTLPIFLSYQHMNELNYIYYELLYFGYPLVHNSRMLGSCGYFYEDMDIDACVDGIMRAVKFHNKSITRYKQDALSFLECVNPLNDDVCRQINEKIKSVI